MTAEALAARPPPKFDLLEEDDDDELDSQDQDQSQPPGTGPYATLHIEGAQVSIGSTGHPDSCMPCTFYCFTRRGCNRGLECRFCHLTHQSKLQQRRESWKKQQREKRKSIRERVAAEALTKKPLAGSGGAAMSSPARPNQMAMGAPMHTTQISPMVNPGAIGPGSLGGGKNALSAYGLSAGAERRAGQGADAKAAGGKANNNGSGDAGLNSNGFAYNPSRVVLTIGQEARLTPQLVAVPVQYRLVGALPNGLLLDTISGVISGSPTGAAPLKTVVVEASLLGGTSVRASLEIEVVDFTRGGFVLGHMSEFEPGKFMLLMYVPDDAGGNGNKDTGFVLDGFGDGAAKAGNAGRAGFPQIQQEQKKSKAMSRQAPTTTHRTRREEEQPRQAPQQDWW